jgi:hypothetical protein
MTAFDKAWAVVKNDDPTGGNENCGCYFDEALHGRFIGNEIQNYAEETGWEGPYVDADNEDDELGEHSDAVDEAIEHLNDNVAEPGHMFGWHPHGGGFMYMPEEWWDEE